MEENPKSPARRAIVINTTDGRRLKPACGVCGAVSWANLVTGDSAGTVKSVTTAFDEQKRQLVAMPVHAFICQNCGNIWYVAKHENKSHGVESDG